MADAFSGAYRKGYFKALLDVGHMLEWAGGIYELKTRKRYEECLRSALRLLLEDGLLRERFASLGGSFDGEEELVIDAKTGEVRRQKQEGGK